MEILMTLNLTWFSQEELDDSKYLKAYFNELCKAMQGIVSPQYVS